MTNPTPENPRVGRLLQPALLQLLRCPACRSALEPSRPPPMEEGRLRCSGCQAAYAVRNGIPLFAHHDGLPSAGREGDSAGTLRTSDDRQRTYWESQLLHRDVDHQVVAGFSRQRWDHVGTLLDLTQVAEVLDVGCGNGFSTVYVPHGLRAVGCDASIRMLQRHPGAEVVMANAMELPFPSSHFDLVTCWEVLHHVSQPSRVLAEMGRVARRWIVIFESNPLNPLQVAFALLDREHRWVLRNSRAYLLAQLRAAGLECVAYQRVGVTFPNKTPEWLYPLVRRLPFRVPLLGISQLLVARKAGV